MRDRFDVEPLPVLRRPPPLVAVAAVLDESEKALVGHVMPFDREIWRQHGPRRELVVPPERNRRTIHTECDAPARDVDPFLRRRSAMRACTVADRLLFFLEGQTLPHVQ